jgi:hypothetical protein
VERVLEYAREHLRQTLVAAGCTFIAKSYEAPRPMTRQLVRGVSEIEVA